MNLRKHCLPALIIALAFYSNPLFAQEKKTPASIRLSEIASIQKKKDAELETKLLTLAQQKNWALSIKGKNGSIATLVGVDEQGYPLYTESVTTLNAASTIGTNALWNGGSTGLNVSGSSSFLKDKVAIWDGGGINASHQELTGRIIAKDAQSGEDGHATHVAGILMSKGIVSYAKGMAYDLPTLLTYTYANHLSEMADQAANLLVSNHSYGTICGWRYNDTQSRWEWYGQANTTEDYKFGFYSSEAQFWDSLAYLSPNYLIVKASGNNRNESGPAVGANYWRYNSSGAMADAGTRPEGISNQDGYDNLPTYSTAKNILTVGNILAIPNGYAKPSDIVLNSSSSVGPTDDGRIKPDVVANGTNVTSTYTGSTTAYSTLTGTSMSSPSIAGSAVLLHELYTKKNETTAWSSTIRGLIIHSANRASANPGPDYKTGWGVPDFGIAGQMISNSTDNAILQRSLNNGGKYVLNVIASGKSPLKVSICWTDPPGSVTNGNPINDRTKKLIHDLDVRVIKGNRTYYPWKLDPLNPVFPASKGDNDIDNVEVIELDSTIAGETYVIEVTHKGSLTRSGFQPFSLIASGIGGKAYLASAPTSNAGSRIESVAFGGYSNTNTSGCKTYSDFRSLKITAETGQSLPFTVKTNSCDASNNTRFAKIFIDFNNDGDFDDAGETTAISNALTNTNTFTGNITIPNTIKIGTTLYTRIVLNETASATAVLSTGNYANGETQDYLITIVTPSNDMAAGTIVYPQIGECANSKKYVTVKLRNVGTVNKTTVPVEVQIKKGTTVVATLKDTCKVNIPGQSEMDFTLQTPFIMEPATTYTFTTKVSLAGDQLESNNTLNTDVVTAPADLAPTNLSGVLCNGTEVRLKGTNTTGKIAWFTSESASTPFTTSTSGNTIISATLTPNKKYFAASNDIRGSVGPINKTVYQSGGYNEFAGNFVRFNNQVPILIESVRMYTANPGKITIILADLASETGTGGYSYYNKGSRVFSVTNSRPIAVSGALSENNPADTGFVYNLNFPVTDIGNHILIMQCSEGATVYRNNSIPLPGPYPAKINDASNLFTITGNSVTSNSGDFNNFYYFFYDMKVSSLEGCPSTRTAVTVADNIVPVITQSGSVLSSSIANGNQWRLNGNDISGANQQQYTATTSGLYKTAVVDSFGCQGVSNEINLILTALNNIDPSKIGLLLAPNPNKGQFRLAFNVKKKEALDIQVLSMAGQHVYHKTYDSFVGDFSETIRLPNVSAGIYMLKVTHGNDHYIKRMVID